MPLSTLLRVPKARAALNSLSSSLIRTQSTKALSSASTVDTTVATTNADNIKVIPSNKLHVSEPNPLYFGNARNENYNPKWNNSNWLKSRFHFSFAEYRNINNLDYGVLRVMNDDLVQPRRGFGTHGHANMEIITYIVNGELTHEDNLGTSETLGRGSIQFMTAGSGIRHSEFNHGSKPLRFIQTWIKPSEHGLEPSYGSCSSQSSSKSGKKTLEKNKLHHLVSDVRDGSTVTPVQISQDCDAYASEMELGQRVQLHLPEDRQAYLLCIEGKVTLNGEKKLSKHDAAEIAGNGSDLVIEARGVEKTENGKVAHILMFTMKAEAGSGRKDL